MDNIKVFKSPSDHPDTTGTSLKGRVVANYDQLVSVLGEPTYDEPSSDERTQVTWVVEHDGDIFTVYDWKTFDRDYTKNELDIFNVGGKTYAGNFIDALEKKIEEI